jgi:hypothetical protein
MRPLQRSEATAELPRGSWQDHLIMTDRKGSCKGLTREGCRVTGTDDWRGGGRSKSGWAEAVCAAKRDLW